MAEYFLLVAPFRALYGIYQDWQFLSGQVVGYETIQRVYPVLASQITFEMISEIAMFLGLIYLNVLLFRKKSSFPRLTTYFLTAAVAIVLIEYVTLSREHVQAALGASDQVQFEHLRSTLLQTVGAGLGKVAFSSAVWIAYLLMSRRVKATFVE